uniref:Calx-beta domain-containing protein n=1 Tax=Macrostomum lignano TaxID=282301 RepID=A0A1I8IXB1_9PLAT
VMQNCPPVNQYSIAMQEDLRHHDTKALLCHPDSAHVTPRPKLRVLHPRTARLHARPRCTAAGAGAAAFRSQLHQRMQLLDLMHTLHIRVATIFKSWSPQEKSSDCSVSCAYLAWRGSAANNRKPVRMQALTYLQRSLLFHDLRSLTPGQWEMCFNKVLFPLLSTLLEAPVNPSDPAGTEETRVRASTLLCKVFLMHLSPLLNLPTFTALWLTILDFMEKYIRADKSELLIEAIPESLKNMLLVMDNACILRQSRLWDLTWHRIGAFLPSLMEELFPQPKEVMLLPLLVLSLLAAQTAAQPDNVTLIGAQFLDSSVSLTVGRSAHLSIRLNQSFSAGDYLYFTYQADSQSPVLPYQEHQVVLPLPAVYLPPNATAAELNITGWDAGRLSIGVNSTNPDFFNNHSVFVRVTVAKSDVIDDFNFVVGILYVVLWSMSFYPQTVLNYRR